MSISYRLTLAGDVALERIAGLVAPNATEFLAPGGNRVLSANLEEEHGYVVSVTDGVNGYYEAADGDNMWQWEPHAYVDITFQMAKEALDEKSRTDMLTTVARILDNTTEDAALILNDDCLLLTRTAGRLHKHNTADWYDSTYDKILPG